MASTAGYYAGFIGLGVAVGITGPTLPELARNTHSQPDALGFLFTAGSIVLTVNCRAINITVHLARKVKDGISGWPRRVRLRNKNRS